MDAEVLSPGIKQQGREAEHSLPSSAEVKELRYNLIPPHVFMAWCLID
jgi:hypothetical protein